MQYLAACRAAVRRQPELYRLANSDELGWGRY
jgi:hypothetical protein